MKIHLFSNHTGMVDARFVPDYKTEVVIEGEISAGTLSLGSHNFEIKNNRAQVPLDTFTNAKTLNVVVSAKQGGKLRHWLCGKLTREPSGAFTPDELDGRAALIKALERIDELQVQIDEQQAQIKKLMSRANKKFLGGADL